MEKIKLLVLRVGGISKEMIEQLFGHIFKEKSEPMLMHPALKEFLVSEECWCFTHIRDTIDTSFYDLYRPSPYGKCHYMEVISFDSIDGWTFLEDFSCSHDHLPEEAISIPDFIEGLNNYELGNKS